MLYSESFSSIQHILFYLTFLYFIFNLKRNRSFNAVKRLIAKLITRLIHHCKFLSLYSDVTRCLCCINEAYYFSPVVLLPAELPWLQTEFNFLFLRISIITDTVSAQIARLIAEPEAQVHVYSAAWVINNSIITLALWHTSSVCLSFSGTVRFVLVKSPLLYLDNLLRPPK